MLVYGYWRMESRLGELEDKMAYADEQIGDLLGKHIVEETLQREQLEEKVPTSVVLKCSPSLLKWRLESITFE